MDFLDPKKRKAHQIRLYIGYGLMALLVGIVAILMLFQAYGYTFNLKTGDISQNGLLFVNSNPVPSTLTLNGQVKGQTDQRLILPAGTYTMQLNREGYREWRRDVVLDGGKIERFVYPFLFPEQLETSNVQLYSSKPAFATQSPDRQWLLTQVPGSYTQFDMYDLNTEQPNALRLVLPESLFTVAGDTHNLSLVEWSTDNRHLVLKHDFSGGSELLLIDRADPALSQNLSKLIPSEFTDLRLRDKQYDKYYLFNKPQQTLQSFELGSEQPVTVQTNVLAFQPHGDDELLFISSDSKEENTVAVRMTEGGETYTIKSLPESKNQKYLLDIARFNDRWYTAMGSVSDGKVYVLRDPISFLQSDPPKRILSASVLRLENPQYINFSQNARFLSVQSGAKFTVYDAEADRNYLFDTELPVETSQKASWMDGHRLSLISEGRQVVFDYDGTNTQTLSSSYATFQPFFNRDYDAVYTLAPHQTIDGRAALLRTELIVEE